MALDKLVDSTQLDADLTSVADAIREKGGTSGSLAFPGGFVSAVEAIESGSGEILDPMAYINSQEWVKKKIVSSDLPANNSVFQNNATIEYYESEAVQTNRWDGQKSYAVGNSTFKGSSIKTLNLPNATGIIADNCCQNCKKLETVNLHSASGILYTSAFEGCTSLVNVDLASQVSIVRGSVFKDCTSLAFLKFDNLKSISSANIFKNCSALKTIVLPFDTAPVTLSNVNNFDGTPFATDGTGGKVYVPSALIESYRAATNWATLFSAGTCEFVAIEGSEHE